MDKIHDRNSIGLLEDIENIVYNLEAINDHLLDLKEDELIDSLELISDISKLRQESISVYAKDINYKYHCAYKHGLKVFGLLKETIQIAKRQKNEEEVVKLLTILERFIPIFNKIRLLYLNKPELEDEVDCMRCLNDIIFAREGSKIKRVLQPPMPKQESNRIG